MSTTAVVRTTGALRTILAMEERKPIGASLRVGHRSTSRGVSGQEVLRNESETGGVQSGGGLRCRTVNRAAGRADVQAARREAVEESWVGGEVAPEVAFYRKYTEGMLRRYMRMSLEMGRVPSMLGKELFRGKVTSYRVKSFEDVIIFVHDVEKCLARLDATSLQLIGRISLQEYTQGEAAGLTGMSLRSVTRKYAAALDRLTAVFLELDLLEPQREPGCQASRSRRSAGSR